MYRVIVLIMMVVFVPRMLISQPSGGKSVSEQKVSKTTSKNKKTSKKITQGKKAKKSSIKKSSKKKHVKPTKKVKSKKKAIVEAPENISGKGEVDNKLIKEDTKGTLPKVVDVKPIVETKRGKIIKEGEKYLGMRYRSKVGQAIFDCSGYVKFLMSKIDKKVTRSSVSQIHDGKKVSNLKDAKPGDILVFKGRNARNNRPGHVGLLHHWSNDTLYFIHSSTSSGIRIDNLYDPYYSKRFLQIRNVIGED